MIIAHSLHSCVKVGRIGIHGGIKEDNIYRFSYAAAALTSRVTS